MSARRFIHLLIAALAILVIGGCAPYAPTTPLGPSVVFTPTGGDDTLALQAAIDANPNLVIDSTVVANGRIFLQSLQNHTITFGPNGRIVRTVLDQSWPSLSVFDLALAQNVTITGATIVGAQPCNTDGTMTEVTATDKQHAFDVRSSTNVHIVGATVSNLGGDGVFASKLTTYPDTTGLVVDQFNASCMGRDGLSVTGDRYDSYTNLTLGPAGQDEIDIEPDPGMTVDHVFIGGLTMAGQVTKPWLSCEGHGTYGSILVADVTTNGARQVCTFYYPGRITVVGPS